MTVSADKVAELLKKQKWIESLVHSQRMPRQAIVETLVQRQHLAELQKLLAEWPASEIGNILETLPMHDALALWEISDALRELLAGNREPAFNESQINAFVLVDGWLKQIAIEGRNSLEGLQPIWIDLLGASKAARKFVGSRYRIEEDGEIHLHSNFLLDREGNSRSVPVGFVLHQGVLFTLQRRRTLACPSFP